MPSYLNTIWIDSETLADIADSYCEAYGVTEDNRAISGRLTAAHCMRNLPDEFAYWTYVCAILEGVTDDEDGLSADDYVGNSDALELMFGEKTLITSKPAALAYARARLLLAYPEKYSRVWLERSVIEEDMQALAAGGHDWDWDLFDRMVLLEQTMWRNLIC